MLIRALPYINTESGNQCIFMKNPLRWPLTQRLGLEQQKNGFAVLRKPHRVERERAGLKVNVFASVMAMIYKYVLLKVGNEHTAF